MWLNFITLIAPVMTTFINFFYCFSEKKRLDVSSESSARQRIHMKNQVLFSEKPEEELEYPYDQRPYGP